MAKKRRSGMPMGQRGGGAGGGGGMMSQIQKLQEEMARTQEELQEATVEVSAGGGAVIVVITGQQKVQSIKVDPAAVDPEDVEMLEDMILAAVNEAIERSQAMASERLGSLTSGLNLPPGLGL